MTDLLCRAKRAINDLFGDTSVSPDTTHARLGELRDEIDQMLDAIRADLCNKRGTD